MNEQGKRLFDDVRLAHEKHSFSTSPIYPKKVKIVNESDSVPKPEVPLSAPSPNKPIQLEHSESAGVASPSDLRRPREDSQKEAVESWYKVAGVDGGGPYASSSSLGNRLRNGSETTEGTQVLFQDSPSSRLRIGSDTTEGTKVLFHGSHGSRLRTESENTELPRPKEFSVSHQDFMKSFLANETHFQSIVADTKENDKAWRQTALQRRAPPKAIVQTPDSQSVFASKNGDEAQPVSPVESTPFPHRSAAVLGDQSSEAQSTRLHGHQLRDHSATSRDAKEKEVPPPARSTFERLGQLPEEDVDFISAEDIRASMGARRSKLPSSEERRAERQKLEQTFAEAQQADIHPLIEGNVINNQLVRRTEREMREAQQSREAKIDQPIDQAHAADPAMESSIERMTKWLETTGANFVKSFWQDPTEEADVTKTRLFFNKIMHYSRKGRLAMQPIVEDLEKDIPVSATLLRRLKSDEKALELAIHQLRQRSANDLSQGLTPRKVKAMENLKMRFQQTNDELEKAYAALREVATVEMVAKAPASLKRRLSMASKVLHKNAQLSRMLVYSLQTRLEDPNVDRKLLTNYKPVADNLLSMRDTQMTLIRLVDHAMLVYGIVPKSVNDVDANGKMYDDNGVAEKQAQNELANCEEPFVRARLAADAHLIDVIKSHKAAIQEPTANDDSQPAKAALRTILDEPKPLANSLFRPFGPVFDRLGKEEASPYSVAETPPRAANYEALKDECDPVWSYFNDDPTANTIETKLTDTKSSSHSAGDAAPSAAQSDHESPEKRSSPKGHFQSLHNPDVWVPYADLVSDHPSITPDTQSDVANATITPSSAANLPTNYTILVHDPQTGALSITTSTSGPPRDTSPALPLHQALSSLDSPAKFIPYITPGLEIITAKKDMLVLRDALPTSSTTTSPFETITTGPTPEDSSPSHHINPIDGTARLSPTGYVGPEESAEQLEKDFDERRHAAGRVLSAKEQERVDRAMEKMSGQTKKYRKERRRGAVGRVVRTAIWAAALCYVVGVMGEIAMHG